MLQALFPDLCKQRFKTAFFLKRSEGATAETHDTMAMFVAASPLVLAFSGDKNSAASFRTAWRPEHGKAMAEAALQKSAMPKHCELGVVGAGWGGAYVAWRLAVDTTTISPDKVCVFEANGRVGGRVYSITDLPFADDLVIDAGAYRFIENDLLPAALVWDALKLPTQCYDCEPRRL